MSFDDFVLFNNPEDKRIELAPRSNPKDTLSTLSYDFLYAASNPQTIYRYWISEAVRMYLVSVWEVPISAVMSAVESKKEGII